MSKEYFLVTELDHPSLPKQSVSYLLFLHMNFGPLDFYFCFWAVCFFDPPVVSFG